MNAGRAVVRGVGELLLTAGAVLLLFTVYQLFWTNVEAGRAQGKVSDQLTRTWALPEPKGTSSAGKP